MREFRAFWGVKISTTTKNMATVKAFFRRVESNGWVEKNPTRLIKEKNTRKATGRYAANSIATGLHGGGRGGRISWV